MISSLAAWLEATPLSEAMRGSVWLYPSVEIVHIVGFAVLVGSIAMFDLRLLGCAKALSVRALAAHLLPWSLASLLLIVPAGLLMLSAQPQDFLGNRTFWLKMGLIAAAGVNAALFHVGVYRSAEEWDTRRSAPPLARLHGFLSLCLWIGVICCGRLLAYT
ncbi:DUF6644 family protein [Massilia endophytica]|uniref:DUF6644 family protein n=1 Tax=Massilia endophytica TaxID=2899220 RepID=UPI001E2D7F6E|nr:DUF6644 family protein [Massilia endophytica]UGQ44928.1 hypothetical protein LSQ66_14085 [Massilia endophytica]